MTTNLEKYISYILDNNPLNRIFPITHKSNHGISLEKWLIVSKKKGLNVEMVEYMHHVASKDRSYDFPAMKIVLNHKGERYE